MARETIKKVLFLSSIWVLVFVAGTFAFTEPTASPPDGNTSAPVTISEVSNTKIGNLILNVGDSLAIPPINPYVTGLSVNQHLIVTGSSIIGASSISDLPDPAYILEVKGAIKAMGGDICADPTGLGPVTCLSTVSTGADSDWTISGPDIYRLTGNVGIGNDNPQQALHVVGNYFRFEGINPTGTVSPAIEFREVGQAAYWLALKRGSAYAGGADEMLFTYYDGVSAWNEALKLKTNKEVIVGGDLGVGVGNADTAYRITTSGGGIKAVSVGNPAGYFYSDTGYGLLVDKGNVGIGTVSPGALLHVEDAVANAGMRISSTYLGSETWDLRLGEGVGSPAGSFTIFNVTDNANRLTIDSAGNVGIGEASPVAHLQVSEDTSAYSNILLTNLTTGYTATDGFELSLGSAEEAFITNYEDTPMYLGVSGDRDITILPTKNVGIGTVDPDAKLEVRGTGIIGDGAGGAVSGGDLAVTDSGNSPTLSLHGNSGTNYFTISADGTVNRVTFSNNMAGGGYMTMQSGRVGIGITSPSTIFHIDDNAVSGTGLLVQGGGNGNPLGRFQRDVGATAIVDIFASGGDPQILFDVQEAGQRWALGVDDTYDSFNIAANNVVGTNDVLTILTTGNVGIGRTDPGYKLHVAGTIFADTDVCITGTCLSTVSTGADSDWTISGQNIYSTLSGNVGIGETVPSSKLEVSIGSGAAGFDKGIVIKSGDGTYTADHGSMLQFENEDVVTAGIRGARESGWQGGLQFFTHTSSVGNTYASTFTEKMRITSEGYVGIGKTDPTLPLYVKASTASGATFPGVYDVLALESSYVEYINMITPSNGYGGLLFSDNAYARGYIQYSHPDDELVFATSNDVKMFIDSQGKVGVGVGSVGFSNQFEVGGRIQATGGDVCTTLGGGGSGVCLSTVSGGGGGGVGGSGTLNKLSKWTPDGSNLGDSLFSDDGTNISLPGSARITNLATPINAKDAVTKDYVESYVAAQGGGGGGGGGGQTWYQTAATTDGNMPADICDTGFHVCTMGEMEGKALDNSRNNPVMNGSAGMWVDGFYLSSFGDNCNNWQSSAGSQGSYAVINYDATFRVEGTVWKYNQASCTNVLNVACCSDAGGVAPDTTEKKWFRTTATADGASADTLCGNVDPNYRMCIPAEWYGRSWAGIESTTGWYEDAWVDGKTNLQDCTSWTSTAVNGIVARSKLINAGDNDSVWGYRSLSCATARPAMCCEI